MDALTDRDTYFAPGSWPFYRRAAIAPLCLCAVAAIHLVRVAWCDQTPWKGGGFGMFSTIDDPYARSVRIYLVTSEGEFPVEPPAHLHKRISELRAAPSREQLSQLAERLAKSRWRHEQRYWRNLADRVEYDEAPRAARSGTISSRFVAEPWPTPRAPGTFSPIEPAPGGRAAGSEVRPLAVRVELWRQDFDAAAPRLESRKQWQHTYSLAANPGSA